MCSYKVTYVFCSQSHSDVVVRVDCSNSKNCLSHRGDLDYTIKLDANSTEVIVSFSSLKQLFTLYYYYHRIILADTF